MTVFLKPFDSNPDFKTVYTWKHDPVTLGFSFSKRAPSYEDFLSGFEEKFSSIKALPPLWIMRGNERVGILYFEAGGREKEVELSIFLDPELKGLKIGPRALKLAQIRAFEADFDDITALIKKSNIGAQKAFEKSGFECLGEIEVSKYQESHRALKYRASRGVFIIAEAGSNFHVGTMEEDLKRAKTLILEAYKSGANAVKFQLYDAKSVYTPGAGTPGYLNEDIHAIFQEYALQKELVLELVQYTHTLGIEFMCSTFSKEHFEFIDPFVQRHKIASYEIRHLRLLECAAHSKKPLILSTGASTEEDIEWAINTFKKAGGEDITLLHCNAQYPADPIGLNLKCVQGMQERFKVPCGFSDHSMHPLYAPLAAISLGACVIEKHFTLSRNAKGPDHFFALECDELFEMVKGIREVEKMLGVAKKDVFPQEEDLALFTQRGLQALRTIREGEPFIENVNIAILRPGNKKRGLHPSYLEHLLCSTAKETINCGEGIEMGDVQWN